MVQVGRVPVLLLDTDTTENEAADRPITHILYVRGREMRLHQELVLGIGGGPARRGLPGDPAGGRLNKGRPAVPLLGRAPEDGAAGGPRAEAPVGGRGDEGFTSHTPRAA